MKESASRSSTKLTARSSASSLSPSARHASIAVAFAHASGSGPSSISQRIRSASRRASRFGIDVVGQADPFAGGGREQGDDIDAVPHPGGILLIGLLIGRERQLQVPGPQTGILAHQIELLVATSEAAERFGAFVLADGWIGDERPKYECCGGRSVPVGQSLGKLPSHRGVLDTLSHQCIGHEQQLSVPTVLSQ